VIRHGVLEKTGGRLQRAGAYPISIDTPCIAQLAAAAIDKASVKR
jgi:hypothetical protein